MITDSIWGKPPERFNEFIRLLEKNFPDINDVCVVGCSDGRFLLPFARIGFKSTGYETDIISVDGGSQEHKTVNGLIWRLKQEKLSDRVVIHRQNFFNTINTGKYSLVFTSGSIQYETNKSLTLENKVLKLQNSVKKSGLIYINYMMTTSDNKEINLFFKTGQMKKYFQKNWNIIHSIEPQEEVLDPPHAGCMHYHYHRVGTLIAQKT